MNWFVNMLKLIPASKREIVIHRFTRLGLAILITLIILAAGIIILNAAHVHGIGAQLEKIMRDIW